jgi:hypothetical protein
VFRVDVNDEETGNEYQRTNRWTPIFALLEDQQPYKCNLRDEHGSQDKLKKVIPELTASVKRDGVVVYELVPLGNRRNMNMSGPNRWIHLCIFITTNRHLPIAGFQKDKAKQDHECGDRGDNSIYKEDHNI